MEKIERIKLGLTLLGCIIILAIKSCVISYKSSAELKIKKLPKTDSTKID